MRDLWDVYGPFAFIFGIPFAGFILALFLTGCGGGVLNPICTAPEVDGVETYIIDGTPSTDRRSTVKVNLAGGYCSGTIVGPHTVLTAAHCEGPVRVYVEDDGWYEVESSVVHETYNFPWRDLQVVYMKDVMPEPYAVIADDVSDCTGLIAQGYGFGSDGALHERRLTGHHEGDGVIITSTGICNGDSGGPLYAVTPEGEELVGVTSFGWGEAYVCDRETGFVSLLEHGDWVRERVQ